MEVSSNNKSPSPLSIRSFPPHPRTSENNNSTPRRSFNGSPFSRPSILVTHRGFKPGLIALLGFDEKENKSKAAKMKSPEKGSKNFMSLTISASSKIAQSPKKKILVERNDPLRTSITLSHEEDEESETEPNEEEFQMDVDLDDGGEVEIEGVDVLEIEEASAIQLDEVNGSNSLEKDVKQGKHDLVETEKVFVVPAEGNESDSSERDLGQGLTTSNVEVELAESQSFVADNALELMIDNPESIVKEISAVEEAQPLEMMESPIRHDEDNVGAYQIRGISSLVLILLVGTVLYVKRKSDKTLHPAAVLKDDEAQSIEKKPRKSNKRESLAAFEFSMGSPSYGSFTTYERIPAKNTSEGEEVTPFTT
ncbi:hypothetical protein CQW23_31734 [Capsicum baccatum]|uniref:Uncharacterized protein n=1 Tax=Capsicum baccatum TaxID=33114 RepID=A0A2G2V6Y7_CAPBA|nr:hypothetical protein CQW23_31734 [Capsicum baccatum]